MGCDIHGFVEVKINNKWYVYDRLAIGVRNYELFGLMGNSHRGDGAVVKPKGIPTNASQLVNMEVERWGEDGHTHTWLSQEEMRQVHEKFSKDWSDWEIDNILYQIYNYGGHFIQDHEELYKDVRMVVWFDN